MTRSRRIIARCYGDEPVVMEVHKVVPVGNKRGDVYYVVARAGSDRTIGWNPAYAFEYSAELYAALTAAYFVYDAATLRDLWLNAAHWRPERALALAVDPSRSTPNA